VTERVGFGGGCHWCTEAVFQSLRGVAKVEQGFIASQPPDDGFSEAVIVEFDPGAIGLDVLIGAHLATHSSASDHALRGKYRSAVYVFEAEQGARAEAVIARLATEAETAFVTRVLDLAAFRASDPRFHGYYVAGPDRPFCRTYIDPKLATLRRKFTEHVIAAS
jgi:peptide-methionine (S)-S-oxide reductase